MRLLVTLCAIAVGVLVLSHQVRHAKRLYGTPDGRCWSAFVPSNPALEQPANGFQQAVRPVYVVEVPCR